MESTLKWDEQFLEMDPSIPDERVREKRKSTVSIF